MKLLIVDDDPLVCQSLQVLLSREADMEVVGTAHDGSAAIACCEQSLPDVVLMDIRMPGMDGIQAVRQMKQRWSTMRVMMLTTFEDERNIRLALAAGADGYMLKSTGIASMASRLRALFSGSAVLDGEVLRRLTAPPETEVLSQLTPREHDIAKLVAEGCSNREIASQLYITEGTVRNTLSIILDKLELRDRTQLAIYYWKSLRN